MGVRASLVRQQTAWVGGLILVSGLLLAGGLFLVGGLAACTSRPAGLTKAERELVERIDFNRDVVARIRAHGVALEQLAGVTDDGSRVAGRGVLLSTKPGEGRAVLRRLRRELNGDYRAYLQDQAFGYGPDKVAVVESADPYVYLAIVRPSAPNYDLDHASVVQRYRRWDKVYDLRLEGAGPDWLEAVFGSAPEDWSALANEVYEFCPDVVDQGTGDVEALAEEMRRTRRLYLWWD